MVSDIGPSPRRSAKSIPGYERRSGATSTKIDASVVSTYVDDMTEATRMATQASSADPYVGLRAVAALRDLVEQLEALQVQNARSLGWSWQEIARELHVSKQAVHRKHADRRFRVRER
jgi:DNA-binding NarL/FixJ family response regulator